MAIASLDDRTAITVSGPDSRAFLQGLLTNDVVALRDGAACYAGLLSPQGKALFDLLVIAISATELLLDVSAPRAEALLKRLTMYRLRAKVELGILPEQKIYAGWENAPIPHGGFSDPRGHGLGWRMITSRSMPHDVSVDDYHRHRIFCGVPGSNDIGSDQFLWLETNADALNGVNYTKGCYVGQENTARMHHRDKIRKVMYAVKADSPLPAPGTQIFSGEREAGQMRSSVGNIGIALLRAEYVESPLHCDGQMLTVLKTPA